MDKSKFMQTLCLEHTTGDLLYPCKIKNRQTGQSSFRLSKGGNTLSDSIDVNDEEEVKHLVLEMGYAVRASTLNGSRAGLYKLNARSIRGLKH